MRLIEQCFPSLIKNNNTIINIIAGGTAGGGMRILLPSCEHDSLVEFAVSWKRWIYWTLIVGEGPLSKIEWYCAGLGLKVGAKWV